MAGDERFTGDLDLGGLTRHLADAETIRKIVKETDMEVAEYKAKYGKDWFVHYFKDTSGMVDYDEDMKDINFIIWYDAPILTPGKFRLDVDRRMHELYGDQYDTLRHHKPKDSRVGELLIADAIKTGKWEELPDELQPEYHARVGDGTC